LSTNPPGGFAARARAPENYRVRKSRFAATGMWRSVNAVCGGRKMVRVVNYAKIIVFVIDAGDGGKWYGFRVENTTPGRGRRRRRRCYPRFIFDDRRTPGLIKRNRVRDVVSGGGG